VAPPRADAVSLPEVFAASPPLEGRVALTPFVCGFLMGCGRI